MKRTLLIAFATLLSSIGCGSEDGHGRFAVDGMDAASDTGRVGPRTPIRVVFNQAVDVDTLGAVRVLDVNGDLVAGVARLQREHREVWFRPHAAWQKGELYRIDVDGVRSAAGATLEPPVEGWFAEGGEVVEAWPDAEAPAESEEGAFDPERVVVEVGQAPEEEAPAEDAPTEEDGGAEAGGGSFDDERVVIGWPAPEEEPKPKPDPKKDSKPDPKDDGDGGSGGDGGDGDGGSGGDDGDGDDGDDGDGDGDGGAGGSGGDGGEGAGGSGGDDGDGDGDDGDGDGDGDGDDGDDGDDARERCNQGVGNGPEGCDPGNSNQGNPARSNDENGGVPGKPGRRSWALSQR